MNIVIQDLRRDHHNFHRVLKLIRHLVKQTIDDNWSEAPVGGVLALETAFSYMQVYVAGVHHQVEDLVFDAFVRQTSPARGHLDRMRSEHDQLNETIAQIKRILAKNFSDTVRNQQQMTLLQEKMNCYFQMQLDHMQFEELSVYPLVENSLSISDWKGIIRQSPSMGDPAFGIQPVAAFKPLVDGVEIMEEMAQFPNWQLS